MVPPYKAYENCQLKHTQNHSCCKVGASLQRLPTSSPHNLFVHVSKFDTGLDIHVHVYTGSQQEIEGMPVHPAAVLV